MVTTTLRRAARLGQGPHNYPFGIAHARRLYPPMAVPGAASGWAAKIEELTGLSDKEKTHARVPMASHDAETHDAFLAGAPEEAAARVKARLDAAPPGLWDLVDQMGPTSTVIIHSHPDLQPADKSSIQNIGPYNGILARILGRSIFMKREPLVKALLERAIERGVTALVAPMNAGKTSILQLMFLHVTELIKSETLFTRVVYLSAADCPPDSTWDDFGMERLGESWPALTGASNGRLLLLLDEMQELYKRDSELFATLCPVIQSALQGAGGSNVSIILAADYLKGNRIGNIEIGPDRTIGM